MARFLTHVHFHPKCRHVLFLRLPSEDDKLGHAGKLIRTLSGARDAANAWDESFHSAAIDQGSPRLYHHREKTATGGETVLVMILNKRAKLV